MFSSTSLFAVHWAGTVWYFWVLCFNDQSHNCFCFDTKEIRSCLDESCWIHSEESNFPSFFSCWLTTVVVLIWLYLSVQGGNAGPSHADRSYIPLKSACDADKARGVRLPGDQSGHIVYTHNDANMVDPRNSALSSTLQGKRGGGG